MRKMLLGLAATASALATFAIAPAAEARQGCGNGFHRNYNGRCVPNRGNWNRHRGPVLVVGNYYDGRGYWDGRRYYRERYRHHNGWRYR